MPGTVFYVLSLVLWNPCMAAKRTTRAILSSVWIRVQQHKHHHAALLTLYFENIALPPVAAHRQLGLLRVNDAAYNRRLFSIRYVIPVKHAFKSPKRVKSSGFVWSDRRSSPICLLYWRERHAISRINRTTELNLTGVQSSPGSRPRTHTFNHGSLVCSRAGLTC